MLPWCCIQSIYGLGVAFRARYSSLMSLQDLNTAKAYHLVNHEALRPYFMKVTFWNEVRASLGNPVEHLQCQFSICKIEL